MAAEYNPVNLGQGFPDFAPPQYIQDAFCEALRGGPSMHQYTRAFVGSLRLCSKLLPIHDIMFLSLAHS